MDQIRTGARKARDGAPEARVEMAQVIRSSVSRLEFVDDVVLTTPARTDLSADDASHLVAGLLKARPSSGWTNFERRARTLSGRTPSG